MNLLRVLAYRRHLDEIRVTARERPAYFAKLYALLTILFASTATAWWFYSRMKAASDLDLAVFFIVACLGGYLSVLFLGTMISWGLVRQSRKSWGVALPEETKVVFFRPGVWAGLTIGSLYSVPFLIGGLGLMAAHVPFGVLVRGFSGLVAFIFGILAVRDLYGVPRKRYLYGFVLAPLLIVALIGIVAAIAIPQWQTYERLVHAAQRAKAAPVAYRGRSPSLAQLREDDSSCAGGLPLGVPFEVRGGYVGRVVGFVPRMLALAILFRSEHQAHGILEPVYSQNLRIFVHPLHSGARVRLVAVVPAGLSVRLGQKVRVENARASHSFACQYIPNLVVPRD